MKRRKIGKYELLGELGQGAMATVYRARDPVLDRVVALKMMFANTLREPDARDRFLREARSAARLQHPNIITVFELGEVDEMPYIAMELLDGVSLAEAMRSGSLAGIRAKIDVVGQLCEGLAYAHRHGVVHRDVKPSNVILQPSGVVKLVDFGIARLEGSTFATGTGQLLGTPNYMAPEQFESATVDHRVDMWAVGVILYELITGRRPFDAPTVASLILRIVNSPVPPVDPSQYAIPPLIVEILERALAKAPNDRYADLEAMGRAVRRVVDGAAMAETAASVAPGRDATAVGEMAGAAEVPEVTAVGETGALRLEGAAPREAGVFGEASELHAIALSPDERVVAVGGIDGSIRLWEVATGMKRHTLRNRIHLRTGYAALTTALAFSRDGRLLAAGHLDGGIYVWDPASGLEAETSLRHDGAVGGLAFSGDGRILASGGADATLKLWEVEAVLAGEARRVMRRQPAEVTALAILADGGHVITGHANRCLRVHEIESGRLVATLHGHRSAPSALAVSADGRLVASGCRDGTILLHLLETRELVRLFEGHGRTVASIAFFASHRQLVSAAMEGALILWDEQRQDPLRVVEGRPGESFACVAVANGSRRLLAGLADGRLRVWELG